MKNSDKIKKEINKFRIKQNNKMNIDKELSSVAGLFEENFDDDEVNEQIASYDKEALCFIEASLGHSLCEIPYAACREILSVYTALFYKIKGMSSKEILASYDDVKHLSMTADMLFSYIKKITNDITDNCVVNDLFFSEMNIIEMGSLGPEMKESEIQLELTKAFTYIQKLINCITLSLECNDKIKLAVCLAAGLGVQEMAMLYLF